jgi:[protein-PII] uridylyltransferase
VTSSPTESAIRRALTAGGSPTEIGALLRRYWNAEKSRLIEAHKDGRGIASGLSLAMDRIIGALAAAVCRDGIVILATGGYGRGRLAPHSDVDLLIIHDSAEDASLTEFLYALWDGNFAISHAVHTTQSAIEVAEQDLVTRTAFLDARLLWGEPREAASFFIAFDRLRRRTLTEFVEAKLQEREDRHDRSRSSRYAIEPDVKEGKGALRDLDTLHWLDRYVSGIDSVPEPQADAQHIFVPAEKRRLDKIVDFFWAVRVHLHEVAGRADETLRFDMQPRVAERLGYARPGSDRGTERFMRHYFLNAKEVGRLTGTACAILEDRALKDNPISQWVAGAIDRLGQETGIDGEENLVRRGGRLTFADHDKAASTPDELFALFLAAARHELDIHPDARATATRGARRLRYRREHDDRIGAILRQIMVLGPAAEAAMRGLAETGLLGRFLPAFGQIVGVVDYGLFRQYTLDEHVLRSFGELVRAETGTDLRLEVATALLLQETARAMNNPSLPRVRRRVTSQAARVLGQEGEAALCGFLVAQKDLLMQMASRRHIADPQLIADLARRIGSERRLDALSLFTECRQKTAGIGSYEAYVEHDVPLLVHMVRCYLTGGAPALRAFKQTRESHLRDRAMALVSTDEVGQIDGFLDRTGSDIWFQADVSSVIDLALLWGRIDAAGARSGAAVHGAADGTLQIILIAEDRVSTFASCAGAVAELGGTVVSASAFPVAVDGAGIRHAALVLRVKRAGSPPEPFRPTDEERRDITARFEDIARGVLRSATVPPPAIGDRRSIFDVTPQIRIDAEGSPNALIVEVETRDRPGLLYLLSKALAEIGVNIEFAFVSTYGHRAVDTFYVQDAPGYKIIDHRRVEAIRRQILRALYEG